MDTLTDYIISFYIIYPAFPSSYAWTVSGVDFGASHHGGGGSNTNKNLAVGTVPTGTVRRF